ncbi:hypothetical protein CK203_051398 [Vitis vinifera]|uniref:Uncharacterized protein n=1 Tax=Vitis vinifera TaxID=29760 RepID=A0A438FLZ6_VITVI|nr:hypothetical protein CK203_051398 [Vitis vinifera]
MTMAVAESLVEYKRGDSSKPKPQSKEAFVNGRATKALVETSATHNFVSDDETKRLKLQASNEEDGIGDGLPTKGQGRATTLPTLNGYPRGGETMHGPYGHRRFTQDPYDISYASKEGVKEEKLTCLATLKEVKDDRTGEPMLKEIEGVLDEFKDVMPLEFPRDFFLEKRRIIRLIWFGELSPLL